MTVKNNARLLAYADKINHALEAYFLAPAEPQQVLFASMRYSLLAGGKRLRPMLALEFTRLCGGNADTALPVACALEMIHTYSLIHDDLPCMDNDDYRRGKLTNHKVFGEAGAVLAGDALLTAAFETAASAELPAAHIVEVIKLLSRLSGAMGMVGGQVLDMESDTRTCTEQEVLDIQTRKTGALLQAACCCGVAAAGGTQLQMQAADGFAKHFGLAFQIQDDILDVTGDAAVLGKATNADENKNTFVKLYGIEHCKNLVRKETEQAIAALNCFSDRDFLTDIALDMQSRIK